MRALRKKKREKSAQKNLHTSRLAYAEEKIKRKKYICAPYMKADFISSRLLVVVAENRVTPQPVDFHALNYRPNSVCMWS